MYGPNKDVPNFYKELTDEVEIFENDNIIACGDWNIALDPEMDTVNYLHDNNTNSRTNLKDMIQQLNMIDIWRASNPDKKDYTWRQPNSRKQGRLDYFLVSENLISSVRDSQINPGYRTDHCVISLKLKFNESTRGPGYWKFNTSLLRDKEYVGKVKDTIEEAITQYMVPLYNVDLIQTLDKSEIQFTIDDQLFLETVLMNIRVKTISHSWMRPRFSQVFCPRIGAVAWSVK